MQVGPRLPGAALIVLFLGASLSCRGNPHGTGTSHLTSTQCRAIATARALSPTMATQPHLQVQTAIAGVRSCRRSAFP